MGKYKNEIQTLYKDLAELTQQNITESQYDQRPKKLFEECMRLRERMVDEGDKKKLDQAIIKTGNYELIDKMAIVTNNQDFKNAVADIDKDLVKYYNTDIGKKNLVNVALNYKGETIETIAARTEQQENLNSKVLEAAKMEPKQVSKNKNIIDLNNPHDIAKTYLDNGANVNAVDKDGNTALHHATKKNNTDLVGLLIAKGANVNAVDKDGNTALHHATIAGNTDLVKLLIDKGADQTIENKAGLIADQYESLPPTPSDKSLEVKKESGTPKIDEGAAANRSNDVEQGVATRGYLGRDDDDGTPSKTAKPVPTPPTKTTEWKRAEKPSGEINAGAVTIGNKRTEGLKRQKGGMLDLSEVPAPTLKRGKSSGDIVLPDSVKQQADKAMESAKPHYTAQFKRNNPDAKEHTAASVGTKPPINRGGGGFSR